MHFLLLLIFVFLQACTTVASSGAQAIYNHKSIQNNLHDQYVTMRAYQELDIDSDEFKNANVNISTFNNVVLLTGQVPEAWQKEVAEKKVRKVAGSTDIYNLLTVEKPTSHWTQVSDTWITTKVKAKLLASNELDAAQVKVVTENGAVFLMGILKPQEAQAAAIMASRTDGVHQVVKVFSYMKITKTPEYG